MFPAKYLTKEVKILKNKKIWAYLLLAVVLAGICTYITYPGIYYSDSYTRWYLAENILAGNSENLHNGLSVFPQYIMALVYKISGEYGLFSFIQAAAFYFTSFLVIDKLCAKVKWLWLLLFIACPLFYGFSVYLEMSVGVVAGINIFILLALRTSAVLEKGRWGAKFLLVLGYAASYFIIFGFRQNALTLVPVMAAVFVCVTAGMEFKKRIFYIAKQCLVIGLIIVFIGKIPYMANYGKISDLTAKGTVWDVAKTLEKVWDNEEYHDWFDFLGEGATETLVEKNSHRSIWGYYDRVPIDYSDEDVTYAINRRFLKLIVNEPKAFISAKWETIMNVMGVIQPVDEAEYEYDWCNRGLIDNYGVRHSRAREMFVASYKNFQKAVPVFRMPYLIYIFVLLLLAVCFKKLDKNTLVQVILLFFGACFYYGAFFITAQSHEFRYFFPAFYMLCIAAFTILSNIKKEKTR